MICVYACLSTRPEILCEVAGIVYSVNYNIIWALILTHIMVCDSEVVFWTSTTYTKLFGR